ncbi:glycoside hydrolase family 18, partial [Alistipes putredinis]
MIRFLAFCAAVATFAACNDWTEMETVDSKVEKPWEQDPALWAEYTAALRAYKQSEHFIVYARLHNSPEKASSEQDFMRCLPDSLDIVTLTNADNFSKFDAEDMDVMREKGTKVLYQVDYAARAEEFVDMQALDAYLDQVVAAVAANGMDGYSFTTNPLATDATARIVEKLAAAKSEGQLLVFEGNPLSLAAADRPKVDFIALDTEKL